MSYKYNSVLLIDDADLDNFVAEKILMANFFSKNIYIKKDVDSALAFLNAFQNDFTENFPEVIFIDINMPLVDGFEFILSLKNKPPLLVSKRKPKLIILTTSIYKTDEEKARKISEDIIYLIKPLTREALDLI